MPVLPPPFTERSLPLFAPAPGASRELKSNPPCKSMFDPRGAYWSVSRVSEVSCLGSWR